MPDFEQLEYRKATAVTLDKIEANVATLQTTITDLQVALTQLSYRVATLEQA